MFDWNEFKSGKVAVWCDTKEKAKDFIKNAKYKHNICWHKIVPQDDVNWDECKEDTCYSFDTMNECLQLGSKNFFTKWNYKIVKWENNNTDYKVSTDCEKCLHKPVCKEIENWNKYREEHIRLREKSILFDEEPKCPYYIEDKNLTNIEKQCDMKPYEEKRKDIFDDWFKKDRPLKYKPISARNTNIKPVSIKFDNDSEIKTIPCDGNTRGKRAELPILYFDYEKCENKEELFEILMKALFK